MGRRPRVVLGWPPARRLGAAPLAAAAVVHGGGTADRSATSVAFVDGGAVGVWVAAHAADRVRRGATSDGRLSGGHNSQLFDLVLLFYVDGLGVWTDDSD